jgi:serine-type D-Ala-D-Ala carboxypeptidase (penicillin-binding protein 5/6)
MNILKTIILSLAILFPLVPQYLKKVSSTDSKVKSASVHQLKVPKSTSSISPVFTAQAVYVLDLDSNTVLFSRNSKETLFPASLTKIMTAVVALEHYSKDQILTVKTADLSIGNTMELKPGDKLTTMDLIYGLLVASGNDAALALAENFPGGYSQFVVAMNKKAEELNLTKTHFNNTSGVEDIGHITTAHDLAILSQYALKNATFRQVVGTKQKEITSIKENKYSLFSTNELLGEVEGVLGVKTGWTPEAGECLITLVNQDSHPVLIVLLGSEDRFGETVGMIDWVYESFSWE